MNTVGGKLATSYNCVNTFQAAVFQKNGKRLLLPLGEWAQLVCFPGQYASKGAETSIFGRFTPRKYKNLV